MPSYLQPWELIPRDFQKKPQVVAVEAPAGHGKTHAASHLAASLQKTNAYDLIIFGAPNHKAGDNIAAKIAKAGGTVINYYGIEHACLFKNRIAEAVKLGIPETYVCASCPYWRGKSRLAWKTLAEKLGEGGAGAIKPVQVVGLDKRLCLYPIIKGVVFNPAKLFQLGAEAKTTPIVVLPHQLLSSPTFIARMNMYRSRQRRERRVLLVVDEADSFFFSGVGETLEPIDTSTEELKLLKDVSPRSVSLTKILEIYEKVYTIARAMSRKIPLERSQEIKAIKTLLEKAARPLGSLRRRARKIAKRAIENAIRLTVFKAARALESLSLMLHLDNALAWAELQGETVVVVDYDTSANLLFSTAFPFKNTWKILLSATMPSAQLASSSLVSPETVYLFENVEKVERGYENVYVTSFALFDYESLTTRNIEIAYRIPDLIAILEKLTKTYKKLFKLVPRGVIIAVGNKTQYKVIKRELAAMLQKEKEYKDATVLKVGRTRILVTYCASRWARSIDLPWADIAVVAAPFLRPPRPSGLLDVLDYARASAEAIQVAMRMARSPRPPRPKLIALESVFLFPTYFELFPDWFKRLVRERYITIEGSDIYSAGRIA